MDVFKAWPGRAESIVISQESYMGCTGGVARGLLGRDDGQQAFDDLTLDVDQDWLSHTADAQPGRDGRLLDIARETLR